VLLTKIGAGKLLLNNTVEGGVSVNAGTATIGGALTVGNSAGGLETLAPGASIGTLSAASVSLASASVFQLEINSSTVATDLLSSTGAVTLALGATLSVVDLGALVLTNSETFTFITGSNVTGEFAGLADGASLTVGANTFTIDYTTTSVMLVAVPEPGSVISLCGGLGVLLGLQRFRRRKS
jgi:hypothetical protein